jgi:hypothetical protein
MIKSEQIEDLKGYGWEFKEETFRHPASVIKAYSFKSPRMQEFAAYYPSVDDDMLEREAFAIVDANHILIKAALYNDIRPELEKYFKDNSRATKIPKVCARIGYDFGM